MKPGSIVPFILAMAVLGCGRAPAPLPPAKPALYSEFRYALGPVGVQIQLVATSKSEADSALDDAFAAIARVNSLTSFYERGSEVWRFNDGGGRDCHISTETARIIRRALEVSAETDGAFDVTAAPLIRLWKRTIRTGALPDARELAEAKSRVGYKSLVLGANSLSGKLRGMSIDLGGIAKGWAVDRAIDAIRARGIVSALVDAGGDGYALGTRLDGTPWRVGIQDPRSVPGDTLGDAVLLSNAGYATSGDYQQYVDIGGVRYAHIVDPRTGEPARVAASVTVVAPDCTTADALATGLSVLGPDAGLAVVERLCGVEAMIIARRGENDLDIRTSSGFRSLTGQK